jgi:DNA-directed RNA polymerase specialized sigma24 family protein
MPNARHDVSATDRAAFEAMYREHVVIVPRYALSRVRGEQAKDVVAETFLVAWRRFDEVPDEPTSWLLGVARRVIATQSRGGARRVALGARLALMTEDYSAAYDAGEEVTDRQSLLAAFRDLSSPRSGGPVPDGVGRTVTGAGVRGTGDDPALLRGAVASR